MGSEHGLVEYLESSLCYNLLAQGVTTRRFVGHTKDVLSVAFSADNRQIVSGARDRTIKLWNTLGVCKYTIQVPTPSLCVTVSCVAGVG